MVIVDDDRAMRDMLRMWLTLADEVDVVGEADNGVTGIAVVSDTFPDAVILDLEMPVMRGDDAIPLMRAVVPNLHVVLHTGAAARVPLPNAYNLGSPNELVHKGSPPAQLMAALRKSLSSPHVVCHAQAIKTAVR